MNASELIKFGSNKLKSVKIRSHKLDTEILLSKTLGKKREDVLINLNQKIDKQKILEFKAYINRRFLSEPIAYILKEKEFWSKVFNVNKSTLIPRPETELMVEQLVKIYKEKSIFILDIGTGSGCILISLLSELTKSFGIGIDISKKALLVAEQNAQKHNLERNIKFYKRSFEQIENYKFDLIVSNPPYIQSKELKNLNDDIKKYEPKIALDGGNDGLDVIKKVIYKAKYILKLNGLLAIEIRNEQFKKVSKILTENNFRIEYNIKDFEDNTRCLISKFYR